MFVCDHRGTKQCSRYLKHSVWPFAIVRLELLVVFVRLQYMVTWASSWLHIMLFKVKPKGLLQKYDEEIDGEQKKTFVLGEKKNWSDQRYSHLLLIEKRSLMHWFYSVNVDFLNPDEVNNVYTDVVQPDINGGFHMSLNQILLFASYYCFRFKIPTQM